MKMAEKTTTSRIFEYIGIASTVVGIIAGIIVIVDYFDEPNSYKGEIGLTYPSNGKFVDFLSNNVGKPVLIDTVIDADQVTPHNYFILENCIDNLVVEDDSAPLIGRTLPLVTSSDMNDGLSKDAYSCGMHVWEIRSRFRTDLDESNGGTGSAQHPLRGKFMVEELSLSGPRIKYILTELSPDS